jgi:hypothetical protein
VTQFRSVGGFAWDTDEPRLPYAFERLHDFDSWLGYVCMGSESEHIDRHVFTQVAEPGKTIVPGPAFTIVNYRSGELHGDGGLAENRVWLEHVENAFAAVQGWPGLFFRWGDGLWRGGEPECHGSPGEDDLKRLALAKHFCAEHATDRMWRSLSTKVTNPNPWNKGCVHDVRIAGPFPFEGESGAGLALPLAFEGLSALPRTGTKLFHAPGRAIRLDEDVFPGARGHQVVLVQCWVRVPEARTAALVLGSDDGVRVFLDRTLVFEKVTVRALDPDDDLAPVELAAGWNRVLAKVENQGGHWGAALRFVTPDGRPIPGIELAADRPER